MINSYLFMNLTKDFTTIAPCQVLFLLFINGVMNLLWIVVLTIAVLAEKATRRGGAGVLKLDRVRLEGQVWSGLECCARLEITLVGVAREVGVQPRPSAVATVRQQVGPRVSDTNMGLSY